MKKKFARTRTIGTEKVKFLLLPKHATTSLAQMNNTDKYNRFVVELISPIELIKQDIILLRRTVHETNMLILQNHNHFLLLPKSYF